MTRLVASVAALALLAAVHLAGGSTAGASATAGAAGCRAVSKPAPRQAGTLRPPARRLDASRRWTLTVVTNCGTFVVTLQPRVSPHATASLVALARRGYFDRTIFHRIVPGFVIQGGDPTQLGTGGPGYTTVDTPPRSTRYVTGVVAMAKAGSEPRGAAGSQFFVMTAAAPTLAPDYAVVGRITAGLATVERIGQLGDPSTEQPTRPVEILRVTVSAR